MATFYEEMAEVAAELLDEFKQGTVKLMRPGTETGPEWNPTYGADTEYELSATVKGIPASLIDGQTVVMSDLMVICKPPPVVPKTTDWIDIDGVGHEIVSVTPIPAAGIPSVYSIVVKS